MPISSQFLKRIYIDKLKCLKDTDIDLSSDKRLIALMGVNGCGKSTILHALACCYKPPLHDSAKDFRFPKFFLPSTHGTWNDSQFTLFFSYRDAASYFDDIQRKYWKNTDRWEPEYDTRPERHVEYIGISTTVPDIEMENRTSKMSYKIVEQTDPRIKQLLEYAGVVLNISYKEFDLCLGSRKRKAYLGVKSLRNGSYSSLSMGAGEQRVFKILQTVLNAPKYSLILIDEIDLLLHSIALKKLIIRLSEIARDEHRQLQIVFTTHSLQMS